MGVFSGATRYNKSIIADIVRFQKWFHENDDNPSHGPPQNDVAEFPLLLFDH